MDKRKIEGMKKKIERLHREMAALGPLMRGSIVRIGTRNKQFYFSLNKDKRTRLIYLGERRDPLPGATPAITRACWRSSRR